MKYRRIEFNRHPILGNLKLDFRDASGLAYDNIILAGENGAGKTVLLDFLFGFSPNAMRSPADGSVEIEFELTDHELDLLNSTQIRLGRDEIAPNGILDHVLTYRYDHLSGVEGFGIMKFKDVDGKECDSNALYFDVLFKAVYSDIGVNFNPNQINTVTAKEVDTLQEKKSRAGNNLATDIKQLLIDINSADADELQQWIDANVGKVPPESVCHRRMKRFTNAFDKMFESKIFKGVENVNGHKDVRFSENGHEMSIDKLSSGEKQIVFRGSFLLKDQNNIDGHVLLIDEPELSMHPKWERKILGFFKNLFTEGGKQKAQMIFATHSEHVVKDALEHMDKNLVVVLTRNETGVESRNIIAPDKLRVVTSAEANYLAFGLYSSDYHIQLYGALQIKENKEHIKDCDRYITNTAKFLSDAGTYTKPWVYGNTNYTTLPTFIRNAIDHPNNTHYYTYSEEELEKSTELLRELI